MYYTIGQVSQMFDLPISTLRYYDKEGFFPNLVRKGNIRYFSHNEIEALQVIECLKKSGLGIKEINQFFMWVKQGSETYEKRKEFSCRSRNSKSSKSTFPFRIQMLVLPKGHRRWN